MTSYIFLTGGLGFIGSHTVVELVKLGYNVIIYDNLSNSSLEVLEKIYQLVDKTKILFIKGDILNITKLNSIHFNIKTIIHFAALKSISESIIKSIDYYKININGLLNILEFAKNKNINQFIFSSSATVYGSSLSPLKESNTIGFGITNPYGRTKYISELILKDFCISNPFFKVICLRYFNPVGCHSSGLIGEDPNDIPNNLMPFLMRVVIKNNFKSKLPKTYNSLNIFGNDYDTKDGTGERDFIHVVDLAKAHIQSHKKIDILENNFNVLNIGTGKPTSVLELTDTFTKINKVKLPYIFKPKRVGDINSVYCDSKKARELLDWEPIFNIEDICRDSFRFIKRIIELER